MRRKAASIIAAVTAVLTIPVLVLLAPSAHAATARPAHAAVLTAAQRGNMALDWAETHTGWPYVWGGTGAGGFDCSGLVEMAFLHAGIALPRTTYEMLASPHLVRVSSPQRGDLVFIGSGHVEFATVWSHVTYGAHDSGSRIGWLWWGPYWPPGTMFFQVR